MLKVINNFEIRILAASKLTENSELTVKTQKNATVETANETNSELFDKKSALLKAEFLLNTFDNSTTEYV